MKLLLSSFLFFYLLSCQTTRQTKLIPAPTKKIEVQINKNIELLGAIIAISSGPQIPALTGDLEIEGQKISWQDWYGKTYQLYQRFKSFEKSELMIQYNQLSSGGFTDDFLAGFLLQVGTVPNAAILPTTDSALVTGFGNGNYKEGELKANRFLTTLNQFYTTAFDRFLVENAGHYIQIQREVHRHLPGTGFITTMESFYQKKFDAYILIPSYTALPSIGFGKTDFPRNTIYNIFGNFSLPRGDSSGFDHPGRIKDLSVHEFGHSFVNPLIDALPVSLIKSTEHLYQPIKDSMSSQAYVSWITTLYEHFVRAGEVLVARQMGDPGKANIILESNQRKGFRYLGFIVESIEKQRRSNPKKDFFSITRETVQDLSSAYP